MSVMRNVTGGLIFRGEGDTDFFCGRCGRILAVGVEDQQIANIWIQCPKCQWINGTDMSLAWAQYAIEQLHAAKLSRERVAELREELINLKGSVDEFLDRNPDIAPAARWLVKINAAVLLAVLTLLHSVYSDAASRRIAKDALDAARQPRPAQVQDTQPRPLTPDEVHRIAVELHRLQSEVELRRPKSSGRHKRRR